MILTDTGDGVWQWPKHSLGMRSRKSFPRRAQRHELRKRASCVSKVGKKSIVKGSVQDIERQRTFGLFHGWKSHFRQVPKNSISHQPSIIWICTFWGILPATLNMRGAIMQQAEQGCALRVLKRKRSREPEKEHQTTHCGQLWGLGWVLWRKDSRLFTFHASQLF